MQYSGTKIKCPQVVYVVRFSHLVVRNVFIGGCPNFRKRLEIFFNLFAARKRKKKRNVLVVFMTVDLILHIRFVASGSY